MDYRINEIRRELENLYIKNGLTEEVLILSMKLDKEINKVQRKILNDNKIYIKK